MNTRPCTVFDIALATAEPLDDDDRDFFVQYNVTLSFSFVYQYCYRKNTLLLF